MAAVRRDFNRLWRMDVLATNHPRLSVESKNYFHDWVRRFFRLGPRRDPSQRDHLGLFQACRSGIRDMDSPRSFQVDSISRYIRGGCKRPTFHEPFRHCRDKQRTCELLRE
jgi:hypothetical protein